MTASANSGTANAPGLDGACEEYGADDAFPYNDLDDIVPGLMENKERVFYTMGIDAEFDKRVLSWVNQVRGRSRAGVSAPEEFVTLGHALHEMRLYKSPSEIKAMRRAGRIAAKRPQAGDADLPAGA